jgi:hypothetical protein
MRLFATVLNWWNNDKVALENGSSIRMGSADSFFRNLNLLNGFLIRVVLPRIGPGDVDTTRQLAAMLDELRNARGFPTPVLPFTLLYSPGDFATVAKLITDDLYSNDGDAVAAAAEATRRWVELCTANKIPAPPPALMSALIERVVFRRQPGTARCIVELARLIADAPQAVGASQAALLIASLSKSIETPWGSVLAATSERHRAHAPSSSVSASRPHFGHVPSAPACASKLLSGSLSGAEGGGGGGPG